MGANFEKSEKYQAAGDSLPPELREVYRQLVEEYAFHTEVKYGRRYVTYEVLAQLVRSGWRLSAEPMEDSSMPETEGVGMSTEEKNVRPFAPAGGG